MWYAYVYLQIHLYMWVQIFDLILDSSFGLLAGIQSVGKMKTTNIYIAKARGESIPVVALSGLLAQWKGRAIEFLTWCSIVQSVKPCKFGESKWNPCWLSMLTSSSGTNHVLNEHEDVDQYSLFAIPSEIMLYQSHPESLVNQSEIPIELSCERSHLALIMSLTSMMILTNMDHLQYHPR